MVRRRRDQAAPAGAGRRPHRRRVRPRLDPGVRRPARYALRVQGAGLYPFASTELGPLEFNTGIAVADGLRPTGSTASVLRLGRLIHGAGGSFRRVPAPSSAANLLFCAISCSSAAEDGSWEPFRQFVEDSLPQFVLMMGDQVYLDDDDPDVFDGHLESSLAGTAPRDGREVPPQLVARARPARAGERADLHDVGRPRLRDGWGSSPPTARRCSRSTRAARRSSAS